MNTMIEQERRSSIKAIMSNTDLSPKERRLSIQMLMDGRRSSIELKTKRRLQQQCLVASQSNSCSRRMEQIRPKCDHYKRNCSIIAPCCGAAFGCRICHDECPVLPPIIDGSCDKKNKRSKNAGRRSSMPLAFKEDAVLEHHKIDRFAIREVICRGCYTRQSSKSNKCVNCHLSFGDYHCSTCNLWMSEEESPYHCHACGFCRVGGQDNFRHCYDCNMCIDASIFEEHSCKAGKYMADCPVCQESLHNSREPSHELPCGHTMHWHCFQELASYDSRCPICKKTIDDKESMRECWAEIAMDVKMQPIPPELSKVVSISCVDCGTSDDGLAWHFLGVQCQNCSSFNTQVERVTMTGHQAFLYLENAIKLRMLEQRR